METLESPARPSEPVTPSGGPTLQSSRRSRVWGWFKEHYLSLGIAALLLWVVAVPIISLMVFSFRTGSPVDPGSFTLRNYTAVYANPLTYSALFNTLIYAIVVSIISLFVAALFAWLIERTDMPGRNIAWIVMLLPIAMPGMLSSMAWVLLLGDRVGLLNMALRSVLGVFGVDITTGPLNIFSLGGMIFIESVRGSTALFLMMVAAFRLMDPSLEEAAAVAGAKIAYTVRRVTAAMIVPALLAAGMYAVIGNLDDFEVPLLIGLPAGIFLLPTLIYFTAYESSQWGISAAYTTIFLVITIVMVLIYNRVVLRKVDRYASITGKAYRPRRQTLGRLRWPALGLFLIFFVLAIGMPLFVLLWASLLPGYEVPSVEALGKLTLENYRRLTVEPRILRSIWNTILLATGTGTATMVLAFGVAWAVVRQRVRGGLALDALSFIPHAIPSVAVGVALVSFYLNPWVRWIPIYGTITIMVLALMTRYLAFASRTSNGAMAQIGQSLEEAAYVSGIGKLRALLKITMPLLFPAFVAGWIWVAAHAFRNLSIPLMMATPENQTIATALYYYWERQANFSLASALGIALMAVLTIITMAGRRLISGGYSKDS